MHLVVLKIAVLSTFCFDCFGQESAKRSDVFPASTARAEGILPKALGKLDTLVESFVANDDVVGAELMVIKNGRKVFHDAYGWRDRESKKPMQTGSVFCVRSMTKPLVGTAIGMLIDEGKIALEDPVAKFLPAFDVDRSRAITVEHLLTHTSGLPMSLISGKDLRALRGIRAVAELGAGHALRSRPGRSFNYSDQGTDTLTALIEAVSGMSAAEFVQKRVLAPLEMGDSTCVMTAASPLRARAASKYGGARDAWTRFWCADDAPLFPFFLGSQGLYSTLEDYARFMQLWLDRGRVGQSQLLSENFIRKALTPSPPPMRGATALPGLHTDYGYLMQLWVRDTKADERVKRSAAGSGERVAFGHSGSDGTWAWVFPEQKAIVLYFTQSRGNRTGLRVEAALGELFLGVEVAARPSVAPPLEQFLGYYAEDERSRYQAVVRDGDGLALETPGRRLQELVYAGEDRFDFREAPTVSIAFERSADGSVTGFQINDLQKEYRVEPAPGLPSVDDIAKRVAQVHRLDLLAKLGPMRTTSSLTISSRGMKGEVTTLLAWPDRYRQDSVVGAENEAFVVDGGRIWSGTRLKPAAEIVGARAAQLRSANTFARFGDWQRWHPRMTVIQRIKRGGKDVFVVRAGDTSSTAPTFYVEAASGRVLREERIAVIDGLGRIGQNLTFSGFRDVSGMLLPKRMTMQFANPMIGRIVMKAENVELGVPLSEDAFEIRAGRRTAEGAARADRVDDLGPRLAALEKRIESARLRLHIPGLALAVVKDGEVVFAKGFGVADLETKRRVTPETIFAIGSTTKAFTSTLVGMLADDGVLAWDDPVRKHLPDFALEIDTGDSEVTLRDLLAHRTGFTRMGALWASGRLSREEAIRAAARAKPFGAFRKQFLYSNVMYMIAGHAAGRAAGSSWEALLERRILQPLGMRSSSTSIRVAQKDARLAKGYIWEENKRAHRHLPMRNLDMIGPAGSINSNVVDMAKWVRFQLGRGEVEGKRHVAAATLAETWTSQIEIASGVGYGMGWMLRTWNGKKVVEHGGSIDGFAAQVSLLPEEALGYVLLANVSATPLQQDSIALVFDAILADSTDEVADTSREDVRPLLGKYVANFGSWNDARFTVLMNDGKLAIDVPGQRIYDLEKPDKDGKRSFTLTDEIAVSFKIDEDGRAISLTMHQSGFDWECMREGVTAEPEVPLEKLQAYSGQYRDPKTDRRVTVEVRNNRLVIVDRNRGFELAAPDEDGKWAMRANKARLQVRFNESEDGSIRSMTRFQNGREVEMPRVQGAANEGAMTVDGLLALVRKGYGAGRVADLGHVQLHGKVHFVHQGVHGEATQLLSGIDRLSFHIDLGKIGDVRGVYDGERGWQRSSFAPFRELYGPALTQLRYKHPLWILQNWRRACDHVSIIGRATVDGQEAHLLRLSGQNVPARTVAVSVKSGLVLMEKTVEVASGLTQYPVTVQYSDYRPVRGVMMPFKIVSRATEMGEIVTQYETATTPKRVPEDAFRLVPRAREPGK